MSSSDIHHRNIAVSMRKSVESLVISSGDALGQALSMSGAALQHLQHDNRSVLGSVSRSPSPSRRSAAVEPPDDDKESIEAVVVGARSSGRGKKKSWYSALYPTYKSRCDDLRRLFPNLPDDQRLIVDYSCALQRDILAHGRLYVSLNYLCFYANILGWETALTLRWKDVTAITKEKTALVIPNAIMVSTESEKYFLTSFSGRDKAYLMLFRVWQNALMDQQIATNEIWQWVHSCYGDELGFNSDDDEVTKEAAEPIDSDRLQEAEVELRSESGGLGMYARSVSLPAGGSGGTAAGERDSAVSAPNILMPTDVSDTNSSDSDRGGNGARCDDEHAGRCVLQMEVAVNIDQLFTMLFTNSQFCLRLLADRGATDYVQTSWRQDEATGLKCREVSYTMPLTQPIGPKSVNISESLVMRSCSRPGHNYSIDISIVNSGVPYADSFLVTSHYCLQRRADKTTTLALYASIKYTKTVWGLVRSFIEKNTWSGLEDYCRQLERALLRDAEGDIKHIKRKGKRRRRATSSSQDTCAPVEAAFTPDRRVSAMAARAAPGTSRWLIAILVVLLILNALLYWRLYHPPRPHLDEVPSLELPREWRQLLESASSSRRDRLHSWLHALTQAIQTLTQAETALEQLLEATRPDPEPPRTEL